MGMLRVAYVSKAYKDAIREVDLNLLEKFFDQEILVDRVDMPYIYVENRLLSLLYTAIMSVFAFFKLTFIYAKYDIVHFSSPTNYFWFHQFFLRKIFKRGTVSVLTVHHVTYPHNSYARKVYSGLIRSFDAIIAVSSATRTDLVAMDASLDRRIYVVNNGVHEEYHPVVALKENKPYLLYVGDEYERKNLPTVLKAFTRIHADFPDIQFFKYGRVKGELDKKKTDALIQSLGIQGSVQVHRAEVMREELRDLYAHALCLVSPSLIEGFGLPVIEAAKCGCLPVVSSISVYRDFRFPSFCYVNDALSVEEWEMKIKQVLALSIREKTNLLNEVEKGVAKYSWQNSAQELASVYRCVWQERKS